MRSFLRRASLLVLVVVLAACGGGGGGGADGTSDVTVMTRNLYLGAGIEALLDPANALDPAGTVQTLWNQVQASDVPGRLGRVADEIVAARPDVVGLQEVALFRTRGALDPQSAIAFDFLDTLLTDLHARGLDYRAAAVQTNFSGLELPIGTTGQLVSITDRDVVLARSDVTTSDARTGTYGALISVPAPIIGTLSIPRGWASVRVERAGGVRFVNTHLEAISDPPLNATQEAQAQELLATVQGETLPTVLVGDFNSNANTTTTASYSIVRNGGFGDAWAELHPGDPGLTCCQASDLRNATSTLTTRIDLVFHRGTVTPTQAQIVGADPSARTATGLWPSDHAGVTSTLHVP